MTSNVYIDLKNSPELKLLFSGKLGSGKDTIALEVANELNLKNSKISYAKGVRSEVDQVLSIMRQKTNLRTAAENIAQYMDVSLQNAKDMIHMLYQALQENPQIDANTRSDAMREALQYWGPTVRRGQDPYYWINKAFKEALQELNAGKLVYVTDGRFPNEVDAANDAGFITIRLETSESERIKRIQSRDGKVPEEKALNHVSETALDDYQRFDLVIDNNQAKEKTIKEIVDFVTKNKKQPF